MVYFFAATTAVLAVLLIAAIIIGSEMGWVGLVEGRRANLKDAIEYCRERQDVALYMAPEGELTMALVRARAIHDIEMELRNRLAITPVRP